MSMKLTQPRCLQFEVLDLVTGELMVHDSCHGDTEAEQLGARELDPTDELAAKCSGPAYVCESTGYWWDPTKCTTWPDGAPYTHPDSPQSDPPAPDQKDEDHKDGGCRISTSSSPATVGDAGLGAARPSTPTPSTSLGSGGQ